MKKLLFILLFPLFGHGQTLHHLNDSLILHKSYSPERMYPMVNQLIDRIDIQTATGTNTYVISGIVGITSYYPGLVLRTLFTNANTASSTLNINSYGAKTLKNIRTGSNLSSGDLTSGVIYPVYYDGTNFLIDLGGSGGITNTATNNEIPKSNGPNIIPSGLFSSTLGNIDLGSTSLTGDRTISAKSSSASNALFLQTTNSSGTATNALQIFISGTRAVVAGVPGQLSLPTQTYITSSLVGQAFGFDFANFSGLVHVAASNTSGPNSVLFPSGIIATANSGTPSNGFGVGMKFLAQNSAGTNVVGSTIHSVFNNVTPGSEGASFVIQNIIGGTLAEKIRFTSQGEIGLSGANFGTSGQVLTSGGTGAAASWTTVGGGNPFSDAIAILKDNSDATKLLRMELGGFTTGTTRVLTPPNFDGIIATTNNAQTISGVQTFSSLPTIPVTPVASTDAASKGYVDGLTLSVPIIGTYGGTGVNNGTNLITLGGNFTTAGAFNTTLSVTGSNTITAPNAAITLASINVAQTFVPVETFTAIPVFSAGLGSVNVTTQSPGDNTTFAASTAFVTAAVSSSGGWQITGSTTFTGPTTIIPSATNTLTFKIDGLATTNTDGAGALYTNTTAATPGTANVSQNHSPNIAFKAFAYKSNATAASESSIMRISNDPMQQTTGILGNLVIKSNINNGGETPLFSFQKNELNGTDFYVYDTFTDQTTFNGLRISTDYFGNHSGVAYVNHWNAVNYFVNENDNSTIFQIGGVSRWHFSASAESYSIVPNADNVYDLGVPGTGRVRNIYGGNISLGVVGNGILIKEGTNATMGIATLSGGTVTVSTTKVTANSRIITEVQSLGTVTIPSSVGVTSRTAGTSFVITSSAPTDTSVVAWWIFEPAP